jgi:hypothetical protein
VLAFLPQNLETTPPGREDGYSLDDVSDMDMARPGKSQFFPPVLDTVEKR